MEGSCTGSRSHEDPRQTHASEYSGQGRNATSGGEGPRRGGGQSSVNRRHERKLRALERASGMTRWLGLPRLVGIFSCRAGERAGDMCRNKLRDRGYELGLDGSKSLAIPKSKRSHQE